MNLKLIKKIMAFDLEEFDWTYHWIVEKATKENRLIENLSEEELKRIVENEPERNFTQKRNLSRNKKSLIELEKTLLKKLEINCIPQ